MGLTTVQRNCAACDICSSYSDGIVSIYKLELIHYSSAQDASSPESSDSGIQTDHYSTSHLDCLLPYSLTSSCRHSNNNNSADDVNDDDNDSNNNSSHVTVEVNSCHAQGQGKVQGQRLHDCERQSADTCIYSVDSALFSFAQSELGKSTCRQIGLKPLQC